MNYEDLTDIGNLAKAIGLSEDKLADLILAKVNEGWTNQEIADFLAGEMNADVSAKGKAQNEMDALLGLGFNPSSNYNPVGGKQYEEYVEPVEEKGPGFWDTVKNGAKAVGGAIAYPFYKMYEGATDIDPLLQLGLVNAVWGDNSVLGMYNSNQQAEKNREAQEAYNSYWKEKEIESDKEAKRVQRIKEVSEARVRLASLQKEYLEGGNAVKAIKAKEIDALLEDYPELGFNNTTEMSNAINKDKAEEQEKKDAESNRLLRVTRFFTTIPTNFKKVTDKTAWGNKNIDKNPDMNADEKKRAYDVLNGVKSLEQAINEANQSAVASKAGETTGKNIEKKKAEERKAEIKNMTFPVGTNPSDSLDKEASDLGLTWSVKERKYI